MLHYFQPLIHFIHQKPNTGLLITFLIALAESLPLIGTIIPGSVTMTAIGVLVGTGILPGLSTLAWASLGAMIGDIIGFGSGYWFAHYIRHIWPFKKYPHWLEHSEQFFKKHGGKSIIIGRFIGPARSTVPLVAGLLKMTWPRFIIAATPSAILWAILYMMPGILIGALAVELPAYIATEFLLIGVVIIIILWLIFWATQYFFGQLAHLINTWIDRLWDTLIQYKPSRPLIRAIAVKGKPRDHYQLTLLILAILTALLFAFLFYCVVTDNGIIAINQACFYLIQSLRTQTLNSFFTVITLFANSLAVFTAGLLVSLGLAIVGQKRAAIHLFALDVLMLCTMAFLKWIYQSPRPEGFQYVASSSSFPSGHTGMSLVIFSALAYFSGKLIKPSFKWIPYTLASLAVLLVASSRLYLGAHWLSDILGSIALGLTLLFCVIIQYRRRAKKQFQTINKTYWLMLILLSLSLPGTLWIYKEYRSALKRYQPRFPKTATTSKQWWQNPTRYLPSYRLNRFGKPIQPFNLAWVDSLSNIQANLEHSGWNTIVPQYSIKGTLKRFLSRPDHPLPLLPWLYHHRPPSLILIKISPDKKERIEIRLWQAATLLKDQKNALWIGTINYHMTPPQKIKLSRFQSVTLQKSGGIQALSADLKKLQEYQYKLIQIAPKSQPKKVKALDWDGYVIIIRRKKG